jgi:hypothetical protein
VRVLGAVHHSLRIGTELDRLISEHGGWERAF